MAVRILITGVCGFVMSVFARRLLAYSADIELTGLDISAPDRAFNDYFKGYESRLKLVTADITDPSALNDIFTQVQPEIVVHGATVTHVDAWEREQPQRFMAVNSLGTLNILQAAVNSAAVKKVLYISSAAVYGRKGPETPEGLQPETGPFYPDELYGISKLTAEMICQRFTEMYALPVARVRLTKVFGAMERPTAARGSMSIPYTLMQAIRQQKSLKISQRSAGAVSDWISVEDVAEALLAICITDSATDIYNIASGRALPLTKLVEQFPVSVSWVEKAEEADIDADPAERYGKNGCYAINKIVSAVGWQPETIETACKKYIAWAQENPIIFK